MHDDALPTWTQRREQDLSLWVDEHLAALGQLQLQDLDDPAVLRAVATRAHALAACAERLHALRGGQAEVGGLVAAFREQLADV
ncbi:hypothetical protein [Conexibacter sp. SYSU D00693]|uniref:hypothetical protein n=1 Tax=Conexibacter sp. SYSU D00693 TaxID=2812560 RepID=UPI00196B5BAB|nr:hypothetical protein [Conexibacter sp. SYSU D00693]